MKAIITRYLPATSTTPSRIKVSAIGVQSKTYTKNILEDQLEGGGGLIAVHRLAAKLFSASKGWGINLASGGLPNGDFVHCFIPDVVTQTIKLADTLLDTVSCSERFDGLRNAAKKSLEVLNR